MLAYKQNSIAMKRKAIQVLIELLTVRIDQNVNLQNKLKKIVLEKFRIRSLHYWKQINIFSTVLKDNRFKSQNRCLAIQYYQQKLVRILQRNSQCTGVQDKTENKLYSGFPLLSQITFLLKECQTLFPNLISILLLLNCSCCLQTNQKVDFLCKICLLYPNEIKTIFYKAQNLYLNKQFKQALFEVQIGIDVCKKLDSLAFNQILSQFFYLKGNITNCIQKWKSSTINYINSFGMNRKSLTFHIAAVESCLINGNYQDARIIIQVNPYTLELSAMSMAIYALLEIYSVARTKYNELKLFVKSDPQFQSKIANYYLSLGIFHFQVMEYQLSYINLQISLSKNINNLLILKWMGLCCYRQQKYKQSLKYFQEVDKQLLQISKQKFVNGMRIAANQVALYKYFGYCYKVMQITKKLENCVLKIQLYQFLLLLQLYSCMRHVPNIEKLIGRYPFFFITPICSMSISRAYILVLINFKRMNYQKIVSKIYNSTFKYICNTEKGDTYEHFQQVYFLLRYSVQNNKDENAKILEQKARSIIKEVEEYSVDGASLLRDQLQKKIDYDFQLIFKFN